MQIKDIKKNEEPLLARTRLNAIVEYDKATPSYSESTSLLATHLKADQSLIAIRHIYNSFGQRKSEIIAYLYNSKDKMQLIEPKKAKTEQKSGEGDAKQEAKETKPAVEKGAKESAEKKESKEAKKPESKKEQEKK